MTAARLTCVVTGASGLVGQHLLPVLAQTRDVIALVRTTPASARGDDVIAHVDNVEYIEGDLTSPHVAELLPSRVDAVIHLAQSRRFREFPDGVADVLAVNVASTEQLTRYAVRAGASHFVYASSGGVYATSHAPLPETAPLATPAHVGWYQASKIAAEALVHAYRYAFTPIVLRPFFVYGEGQARHMLLPRLCDAIRAGRPVQLAGEQGMSLSLTHANDAAAAIVRALELAAPATINLAGPEALTVREIAVTLGAAVGVAPVFDVTGAAGPSYVADTTLMRALLGAPQHRFAQQLHTILH